MQLTVMVIMMMMMMMTMITVIIVVVLCLCMCIDMYIPVYSHIQSPKDDGARNTRLLLTINAAASAPPSLT